MTVGVAAITQHGTNDPRVLLGADRLLTTRQLSAIEHEHSESKLSVIGERLPAANLQCVFAGAISLGEALANKIGQRIAQELNDRTPQHIGVQHVAEWSAEEYRNLVREKIENVVLHTYGLEIEDLSRQHQFKDEFFNGVLTEVENTEKKITDNLSMLLAGVDTTGAYIYGIQNNDTTIHNNTGYATIGSGTQPAQSTFMKDNYSKSDYINESLSTVSAALYEAREASGVGGEIDIGVIGGDINASLDRNSVTTLMQREETIAEKQEELRQEEIADNPVDWEIQR